MKDMWKYKALSNRLSQTDCPDVDRYEVVDAINKLIKAVESQAKTIQDLNQAYIKEVVKESEFRPY